ncbi:MAG: transcriptional repressor [Phycisphaeraceae bacterium]|nr:transcriptional repressor [Phycisphaeraceae bacterium]
MKHTAHHEHEDHSPGGMLRRAGLRATEPRLRVIRELVESDSALTAGELIDRLNRSAAANPSGAGSVRRARAEAGGGKTDRVTVYRTLNALVEANLAHRVDTGDRVFRYSLTDHSHCRGEDHDHDHPHVVCDACGRVECIEGAEVSVVTKSGRAADRDSALTRFRVTRQDVTLHGVCDDCQR